MTDVLDELTSVLAAQAAELRELVPLLGEQQAALMRADTAAVGALMTRQEPLLARLMKLEQRRRAVVTALAARLGIEPARVTVSALIALVPGAATVLEALRGEMRRLLAALDTLNRRNAFMIDRAVTCMEGLVRAVLTAGAEPAPAYVATGRHAGRPSSARLLDRSV